MPQVTSRVRIVSSSTRRLAGGIESGLLLLLLGLGMLGTLPAFAQETNSALFSTSPSLWEAGVGEGFAAGARELNVSAGAAIGMAVLGSRGHHDLVLGSIEYGYMLGQVVGRGHWYQGNWEVLGQLFGGGQFHPDSAYVIGLTPHLRYNFITGSRWVPFLDLGAGVTATDIRNGDLSTTFEFNLQAGPGVRWFVRDDLALSLQALFMHMSNAGIQSPNLGVNTCTVLVGMSWWFGPRH